jgi:hypothetical protein
LEGGFDRYGTIRNWRTGTLNILLVSYSAAKELRLIVVRPPWNRKRNGSYGKLYDSGEAKRCVDRTQ